MGVHGCFFLICIETKQAKRHLLKANILLNNYQDSLVRFQPMSETPRGKRPQLKGLAVVQMLNGVITAPSSPADGDRPKSPRGRAVSI